MMTGYFLIVDSCFILLSLLIKLTKLYLFFESQAIKIVLALNSTPKIIKHS
jgi:hypothetical protein